MVKAGVSLLDCLDDRLDVGLDIFLGALVGVLVCLVLSLLLFINIVPYSISLPFLVIRLIYCYLDICYFRFKFHRDTLCTYVLMYLLRV